MCGYWLSIAARHYDNHNPGNSRVLTATMMAHVAVALARSIWPVSVTRGQGCWAQPDPPLSPTYPTRAENVVAREVADRPPKLTAIVFIRLTLPFLSRSVLERLNETLRAIKQLMNTNAQIVSSGIEFSPATSVAT